MIINYSNQEVIKGKKFIFLAGPTPRSQDVTSWRIEACHILEKLGFDGIVYIPEYSNNMPKEDYVDQAMWKRIALTNSTVVVFWIPRKILDMPAFTTNVEFGYWLHSGKAIYGHPLDATKVKYLDWLYKIDCDKEPIFELENLLKEAINLVETLYNPEEFEIIPVKQRKILEKKNC